MPVLKSKAYTAQQAIENALNYIEDKDKTGMLDWERFLGTKSSDALLQNAMNYSANPNKTILHSDSDQEEQLVSGYRCRLDLAKETFERTRAQYYRNGHRESVGHHYKVKTLLRPLRNPDGSYVLDADGKMVHDETEKSPVYHDAEGNPIEFMQDRVTKARVCYMWVMSFAPASVIGYEIDPHLVHQIGLEFCAGMEEITGLEFPFVVATHMDKKHTHNHIMQSAYSLDGHRKYRDTMDMLQAMRDMSDQLSQKYGLPIIVEPENAHSRSYSEWKLAKEGKSWKDMIRQDITYALEHSASYEEYLRRMKQLGYTLRETEEHITYYTPGKEHRCRDIGLGNEYGKSEILRFFDASLPSQSLSITEEIIDPAAAWGQRKTYRIYVSRYTASGRRRSDLEMLLLKAIKILKLLGDRFSHVEKASKNPIYQSSSWKIDRLQESIGILNTHGIGTMEELNQRLQAIGARHSHAKNEAAFLSASETTLQTLKDSLQNIQDLQDAAENLGITDLFLTPATRKETAKEQARLFPMDTRQRRELFLALQEHPSYKTTKFDTITHYEAEEILDFLKGNSPQKPDKLMSPEEWEQYRLEAKYQAITQKTLAYTFSQLADKPLPDALAEKIRQLHLPIPSDQISLAEGIHLSAYYGGYPLEYAPAKRNDPHVSPSKAAQLKELLSLTGQQINIPAEQLKKQDADQLFTNLLSSGITPDIINTINEQEWENSLWQLSYEQRQTMAEYRETARKLALAGYDIADHDHAISDISQRLKAIDTARKIERELANEYRTLLQVRRYVKLAGEPRFVKGSKWAELSQENIGTLTATEHRTKLPKKNPQPDEKKPVYEEPQKRKTFRPELNI